MQVVILAGGKGTRMGELSQRLPKPMVPVGGKPLLEHQIELARRFGLIDVILLTGYRAEAIEDHFGDGSALGVRLRYHRDTTPLGTGGAIKAIEDWLSEDFMVFYGDILMDLDLARLIRFHREKSPIATLVVHPNRHPYDSDLLDLDHDGRVTAFYPKPRPSDRYYRNLVNAALYVLSPSILRYVPPTRLTDMGRDIFPAVAQAGERLFGYNTPEYLSDVGTTERLQEVDRDVRSGRVAAANWNHPRPAFFLDRDGVLNQDCDDVKSAEQLDLIPGAVEAVRRINQSGYLAVVVSNQPAIAKGFLSEEELRRIDAKLDTLLGAGGAYLDRVYYCFHHPERGFAGERPEYKIPCQCRKPAPGMILAATAELNIDLGRSFLVGDRTSDIEAGARAGCTTVLVRTGCAGKDLKCPCRPDHVYEDLLQAVSELLPP